VVVKEHGPEAQLRMMIVPLMAPSVPPTRLKSNAWVVETMEVVPYVGAPGGTVGVDPGSRSGC
jgi:hypothetical protein